MKVIFKNNRLNLLLLKKKMLKTPTLKRVGSILPGQLLKMRMMRMTLMLQGREL